jgi:hypothetical protein
MTYADLIKHFGSQGAAARALGLSQPSVCDWQEKGIPLPRQAQYEIITDGALKAELPVASERAA